MQVFCGEIKVTIGRWKDLTMKVFPYYTSFISLFYFPFCMSTIVNSDLWLLRRNRDVSAGKIAISFRLEYWVCKYFFLVTILGWFVGFFGSFSILFGCLFFFVWFTVVIFCFVVYFSCKLQLHKISTYLWVKCVHTFGGKKMVNHA